MGRIAAGYIRSLQLFFKCIVIVERSAASLRSGQLRLFLPEPQPALGLLLVANHDIEALLNSAGERWMQPYSNNLSILDPLLPWIDHKRTTIVSRMQLFLHLIVDVDLRELGALHAF